MTHFEIAKETIKEIIEYHTKDASEEGYGTQFAQNTMNYVHGLQKALEIIEWSELQSK